MDVDRDPTDLGLPWLPVVDEAAPQRHVEVLERPRPPASERVRGRVRAEYGFGRSRASRRLLEECPRCSAGVGLWCRFGSRGSVPGRLHPERAGDPD